MAKANVLIVEDETILAAVIAKAVKKFEYEVIDTLDSGEAAVAVALQKKPDLMLVDIRLQGELDGIDAVEQIQQQLDIPIIYLTAYADEPTLERAKKTRPYGFISKPFQESELKTIIEMAIYKHDFEMRLKRTETERKNLEAQLLQAQKMEALGQLAGGVAHDFNNMLTGISGFAQFAFEQIPEDSPAREDIAEVLKLAKRAEALTRQLLTFSRRQISRPEVLNINRTVEEMMKLLGHLIGENIELDIVMAPDSGNVNVDPGQLEQVLVNLVLNARDAMPAGGKLVVETDNVFLDQEYARANLNVLPGEYVMLAVSDSGCGMDEKIRQHIFEPFFTTKPQGKGTGLGLSTVYGIVSQLKGTILVESKPGQGTTFKIYLPLVTSASTVQAPDFSSLKSTRPRGTILIVEDDAVVLQIARRAIEVCGYRVLTAASSSETEKILQADAAGIDLILLDVMLPGLNGYQLFESVHGKYPHLRVLYMSGYTNNEIVNKEILARGLPFIQKPFSAEALALKTLEVLGEKYHD